jgi:hypothetical protein
VNLGLDGAWLDELVDQLRQEVQVYEVEAVTLGDVPPAMLGWWIPPELAVQFQSEHGQTVLATEGHGEDDVEFG